MKGYLPGPSITGLYGIFEADYGDPSTSAPYCKISPSTVGGVLLPFKCPKCDAVLNQFSDAASRECYHDVRKGAKGNYWCPACGFRFYLDTVGVPLATDLKAGVSSAPSIVRGLKTEIVGGTAVKHFLRGCDTLCAWSRFGGTA